MNGSVLIAGGSGLIGTALQHTLELKGYSVKILGRGVSNPSKNKYQWDPATGNIDPLAFENVEVVINLAGANVGEGRWTKQRKKILTDSRIQSTSLLVSEILQHAYPVKKFIQASATGYYGTSKEDVGFDESDKVGENFLAILTQEWEKAALPVADKIPLSIIRVGVVLSKHGGALKAMANPIRYFLGSVIGSGKQVVPWIHIDDIVQVFVCAMTPQSMVGTFNAVSPHPVNNRVLTKSIAQALHRPVWPIPVPGFILKILLGEQAQIVLEGNRISCKKLEETGFKFRFTDIRSAVNDLLEKRS